ncbi:MAG: HD domain-containing protein [Fimbriimonadaceae bacterium]
MIKQQTAIDTLLRALEFSARKHIKCRRKNAEATPYINHPIEVAQLLSSVGEVDDLTTLLGAVLHDTIEDTETEPSEIEEMFGREVRDVVMEVSDDKKLLKADRKRLQVENAPHLSRRAQQVKLADKIMNVRDVTENPPSHWSLERRLAYLDWAERVVAGLRGCNAPLEALFDERLAEGRRKLSN